MGNTRPSIKLGRVINHCLTWSTSDGSYGYSSSHFVKLGCRTKETDLVTNSLFFVNDGTEGPSSGFFHPVLSVVDERVKECPNFRWWFRHVEKRLTTDLILSVDGCLKDTQIYVSSFSLLTCVSHVLRPERTN